MKSETRLTLLERLREGANNLAWDEFHKRYWRLIHVSAKRHGCSDHTAEEIVQDVVLTVFEKRDVYRHDPARGRFRDWLGALVRNKVADHRRRPSQRLRGQGGDAQEFPFEPPSKEPEPDAAWEAEFEDALLAVLLEEVRREMNPQTYQAFELFTFHCFSGREVAKATGLTRNAVYQARKNVVKRLRELGGPYGNDGQLDDRIKRAMRLHSGPAVEQSLADRIAKTMESSRC